MNSMDFTMHFKGSMSVALSSGTLPKLKFVLKIGHTFRREGAKMN
jgi:hypothetical protein